MSAYHLCLLALAALGTLACARDCRGLERAEALAALAAMGLAMTGALPLLIGGSGVLALIALRPLAWPREGGALCYHRAASNLLMAAVLLALFTLNGAVICGAGALPLLTLDGVTLVPMASSALTFLQGTALALLAYLALSLGLGLRLAGRGRAHALYEILPMTLATFGMAVRLT
ncbi:hypothetical protein SAMN06297129_1360 [Pseudooceanicola antarcticus]|uniref:Uncharacterized protein n=1 Tax=Pseudooceanicola antarcticus TaxID=1247613 RepID=A0A285IJY3_9RHOB|nr:hypothetical protein [Pseudooceanicola antarcticus]PJE28797.1 hypothetical protein CVM39_10045 [Pseudooceanicola antarcticus]SNY48213.1 hypothetical protein SAMN06297129_1360 [Pseudooceanicola antarcticus]